MAEYVDRLDASTIPVLPEDQRVPFKTANEAFEEGWRQALEMVAMMEPADVVERPKEIAKERLAEILQAEIEGRLKMSKPPLMETCGSCKHFHPYPGMATGPCDCRVKLDRRRQPTSQVLYVSQSRVRCRDDYEPREGAT